MQHHAEIPNPTPNHTRIRQLDVLRGVAILLVLCRHAPIPWSWAGPMIRPVKFLYDIGWTGVDLFFVLSGFLIGGLLFKEIKKTGRLDAKRFFIRRGLKIWPAYFFFLAFVFYAQYTALTPSRLIAPPVAKLWLHHPAQAVASIWNANGHSLRQAFRDIMPNLVHAQNYFAVNVRPVTWSLAVEEHFYLLLPLFLLIVVAWRKPGGPMLAVPIAAATVIVLCIGLRFANWNRPYTDVTHAWPTHLRIDGLFFGVLLAYFFHLQPHVLRRAASRPILLLALGVALVTPMAFITVWNHKFAWTIGFTMLYLGYGCILVACVHSQPGKPLGDVLASRPAAVLAWVGVYSYSIYLWHFDLARDPIIAWIDPYHPPAHHQSIVWLFATILFVVLAVLTGALLSRLVEFPTLKLRDRLFPAPADAVEATRVPRAASPSAKVDSLAVGAAR